MSEKVQKLMNDSPVARWTVLILVALMMFFAYMFVDVMSPLKSLVESNLGWNSGVFGTYAEISAGTAAFSEPMPPPNTSSMSADSSSSPA